MDGNKTAAEFTEKFDESKRLKAAIELYRRTLELEWVEKEMDKNKPMPTGDKGKIGRAIIDGTVNAFRRGETQRLSEKKKLIADSIAKLKEKNAELGLSEITADKLKSMADSFFEGDTCGFRRTMFVMLMRLNADDIEPRVCGGEADSYVYGDDTLEEVSEILFGDRSRIANINDKLFENYHHIVNGRFWERNKSVLIGAGISLALITVLTPLALGGLAAGSAIVTSCLAQIGHCVPGLVGAGIAAVTGYTLIGATILGGGVMAGLGIDEAVRRAKARDAYRSLKPDDIALLLAMKATLIEYGMEKMDSDTYKTELDECLSNLNDMRSDAEYMLIVEKTDAENSKKKIDICNCFIDRLTDIVGI